MFREYKKIVGHLEKGGGITLTTEQTTSIKKCVFKIFIWREKIKSQLYICLFYYIFLKKLIIYL